MTAPANTGNVVINNSDVSNTPHINKDSFGIILYFRRPPSIVPTVLIEFKILDTPKTCTPKTAKSTDKDE